jgi:Protein of unknown function (DUF669)
MKYTPGVPGEGTAVPDGEYQFEVTNAEEKTSESSGNDMIELTLKIKDGPTVYDYLTSTDGSRWKLDNFRAAIGEAVKPGVPVDIDPDSFVGRRGTCLLYTDVWQGKKKNKVSDYVIVISGPGSAPQAGPQPPSPKDKWR